MILNYNPCEHQRLQEIDNYLLNHHSYMEESTFNKFIKEKIWRAGTHRNLILLDYKQLA